VLKGNPTRKNKIKFQLLFFRDSSSTKNNQARKKIKNRNFLFFLSTYSFLFHEGFQILSRYGTHRLAPSLTLRRSVEGDKQRAGGGGRGGQQTGDREELRSHLFYFFEAQGDLAERRIA
jgi:hypothetical protein